MYARLVQLVDEQKGHHPPEICPARRWLIADYCPMLLAGSMVIPQILRLVVENVYA